MMQGMEDETERHQTLVSQMKLDASSSDGIKQLKDYAGGNRFSIEFEESSKKYEDLVESLECESQHRQTLIGILQDGDAYYDAAFKEATIIANAYRSFGNRLHSMKKKLDNKIRKFATAEKEAPVSAPKASFLSSGLSGILEQMNDSPRSNDAEQEGNTKDKKEIKDVETVDTTIDHVEVADMDIDSDSENDEKSKDVVSSSDVSEESNVHSAVSTNETDPIVQSTPSTNVVTTTESTEPKTTSTTYGYTITADTQDSNNASPSSILSAPSPEGSPDLNLDVYNEQHETNIFSEGDMGTITNESLLKNDEQSQIFSHLINNQHDVVGTAASGEEILHHDQDDGSDNRPLSNLLGNLLVPSLQSSSSLVVEDGSGNVHQGEVSEYSQQDDGIYNDSYMEGKVMDEVQGSYDSSLVTGEERLIDNTRPDELLQYNETSPMLMQHDSLPPIIPS
ncbi:regulation of nuclear pre-mRNA domain-containing protein 2-like [Xenia sp. Carnegie-2017]|uniref:regulation of nuclear pre-mRNA domain-containing protein 2-like n=1 Tax=Xenia sp. Carnegie-2017 TaxID=2897299 RepID=UPI001F03A494|nr:regulation of nuclear pre-mRNA domain-containing protein 2-like [Xenia sp. Carnegie-2017]